jgi:hypothetical protein
MAPIAECQTCHDILRARSEEALKRKEIAHVKRKHHIGGGFARKSLPGEPHQFTGWSSVTIFDRKTSYSSGEYTKNPDAE